MDKYFFINSWRVLHSLVSVHNVKQCGSMVCVFSESAELLVSGVITLRDHHYSRLQSVYSVTSAT